jgi:hypothetical protein
LTVSLRQNHEEPEKAAVEANSLWSEPKVRIPVTFALLSLGNIAIRIWTLLALNGHPELLRTA